MISLVNPASRGPKVLAMPRLDSISATFLYDGDGKRVAQTLNGATTYFIGNYYEKTGNNVTKYYYAGSQRVAMRTNGTLYYLLSDHLGSTSLTTDASGNVVSELRYTACPLRFTPGVLREGEVRLNAGVTPTQYRYTGQYSYTESFGLMFYNARWLDVSLGRFAQADSFIPRNVQGLDRYAYVKNSPVKFVDPSGHIPIINDDDYGNAIVDTNWHSNHYDEDDDDSEGGGQPGGNNHPQTIRPSLLAAMDITIPTPTLPFSTGTPPPLTQASSNGPDWKQVILGTVELLHLLPLDILMIYLISEAVGVGPVGWVGIAVCSPVIIATFSATYLSVQEIYEGVTGAGPEP